MSDWNASDMASQDGRLVAVTGANSGLGFHVSLELARAGARVIMGCRSGERGEEALGRIPSELSGADAELRVLARAARASVGASAGGLGEPLDVLVNNAGVRALPR